MQESARRRAKRRAIGVAQFERALTDAFDAADATAESLRALAVLLNPVMPKACARLWASLGAPDALGPLAAQPVQDAGRWGQLPAGSQVRKSEVLFPRLPDDEPTP